MRKQIRYTVPGVRADELGQRDNGKTFIITEMPADQAERWALRALFAMRDADIDIPEGAENAGMAALAAAGLKAMLSMPWDVAAPLLDEMMTCVQYEHSPMQPAQPILSGHNSQIEEVKTRLLLRSKVFELHTGFSLPVAPPTSGQISNTGATADAD